MAEYRERLNYGEMAKGAFEIGGSFIINGFAGRYTENIVKPNVTPVSSTPDKILAGAANNVPKVALYYILNKLNLKGAAAAAMGSLGYDVLIRLTNHGINPASIYINQYRVLNQKDKLPSHQAMQPYADWAERQRHFGAMPFEQNPETISRQRKFGTMPFDQNPEIVARQRKFGTMNDLGFLSEKKVTTAMKVFNMK